MLQISENASFVTKNRDPAFSRGARQRDEEKWDAARLFRRNQVHADCVNLIADPALTC